MSPQEHDIMRAVEDRYWWYQALRAHVADLIAPAAESDLAILDAGCGTGGMLAVLREKFPRAKLSGVDLSPRAVELAAARKTGAEISQANVSELPFPEASFDFVLSLDILTHAGVDETQALRETHRVLRPRGQFIINVAAFDFLKGAHDRAVEVDRRYTRVRLAKILRDAHFTIERLTYWNMFLLPPIALVRWCSRREAPAAAARSDFRPLPNFANNFLRRLARLELSTSRRLSLPFGTSLLAVARKNA